MCAVSFKTRKGHLIPLCFFIGKFTSCPVEVLGAELRSSERAASTLNSWTISKVPKIYFLLFYFYYWFYWAIHFHLLFSLPLPSLSTLSHGTHAPNLLRRSFFYFPCRLNPCMPLLGSSLLTGFSGIVNCRLAFFALCLKATYEWVHMMFVFCVWLTSLIMLFSRSIHLPANLMMSLFFSVV